MNDKLEKRNHLIHFIEKWFIIGLILFIIVQLTAFGIINMFTPENQRLTADQHEEYDKDYIGHWYNGTFFINMKVKENFDSQGKYDEMIEKNKNDLGSKICFIAGGVTMLASISLICIAAYKERKRKLLEGNTPNYIILGGLLFLLYKIIEEIDLFIEVSYWNKYSKGFLSTASYYPQMHYIFILPVLLILLGLVLRNIKRRNLKKSVNNNDNVIKIICCVIITVGLSFIVYRFGVRLFELINMNSNINIRLPFYYYIFDLPRSYASSASSYSKLIILRFIKDLPVFVASTISLILFYKIVTSSIKENIISKENNKRYKIIFISLAVASLIFNILGIFEVRLLNNEFLYQYKEATYTIAIRSLTEPLLYGFFIYLFKHYIEVGYLLNNKETSKDKLHL